MPQTNRYEEQFLEELKAKGSALDGLRWLVFFIAYKPKHDIVLRNESQTPISSLAE